MDNPTTNPSQPDPTPSESELEQVRELLLGREKVQLSRLQERLENPELHASDVGRVLPRAVRIAAAEGGDLAHALSPAVEAALEDSVRRRPSILTNVVFPVLGPAIRRAVAEAFGRLVQSINQGLEHGLSPRGLRWRLEAWRTGRSFAEIVLYHTLVYRVEQVLLIQRPSGLLLHQVARPDVPVRNGDIVSGMLTAIQDFVVESFRSDPGDDLQTLDVGGMSVWIESGPSASLAAVIRGHPRAGIRQTLQQTVERIHRDYGDALASPDGSLGPSVDVEPILSDCLLGEFDRRPAWGIPTGRLLAGGLAVLALLAGIWAFLVVRDNLRWTRYLGRLDSEEGILVAGAGRQWGRFHVTGWRDPLAANPTELLAAFQIKSNRVASRWEPYQAISPGLVVRRAVQILQPPAGVELRFENGVLRTEGVAPRRWADAVRHRAETLPGVRSFEIARTFDGAQAALSEAIRRVESSLLFFDETTRLTPGQEAAIEGLAGDLARLREAAETARLQVRVSVRGHADPSGTPEYNMKLSLQRAEETRRLLDARGEALPPMTVSGLGSSQPLRPDLKPSEETLNRRVSFRAILDKPNPAPSP